MSNLIIVRSFEIATLAIYILSLIWILRTRNPVYLGAMVGATFLFAFDWTWIQKAFFNVTYNPDLIWIPGIEIMGIREPASIPFAYGMAFGPFAAALVMMKDKFDRFGPAGGAAIVWVIGAVGVMLYEIPVVYILHIWTYHQEPAYMIFGVPWSDIWLAGNMVMLSYLGLRYMEKWAAIPAGAGFNLNHENTWKGLVMGATPIWAAFYITYIIQIFWYSWSEPWIEGVRPF